MINNDEINKFIEDYCDIYCLTTETQVKIENGMRAMVIFMLEKFLNYGKEK